MGLESRCDFARCLCLRPHKTAIKEPAEAASQLGTVLGRIHLQALTHAVVRTQLLMDHWTEGYCQDSAPHGSSVLCLLLIGGFAFSLPHGPLHKATHNMIAGFPQSKE